MVEVFKTNVEIRERAHALLEQIHASFPGFKANFDLEDCDNILRVESHDGSIDPQPLVDLLNEMGHCAMVLPDAPQPQFILSQSADNMPHLHTVPFTLER